MSVQVIGSGGQRVTAVGSPSKRVDAAAVRIVGAGSGGAGLFRTQFHELLGDPYTLDDTDGVIGGAGTVTLPEAIEAEPRAWVISAFSGDVTLETDGEPIFDLGNGVTEPYVIPAGAVVHLLRYVGVWRIIYDSAVLADGAAVVNTAFTIDLDGLFDPTDPTTNTPEQRFALIGQDTNPSWNGVWVGTSDGVTPAAMEKVADLPGVDGYVACLYLTSQVSELGSPLTGGFVLVCSAQTTETLSGTGWYIAGRGTASGGGPDLSDTTPEALGTADAGVSDEASRADHVHDMPTAADIAVDASGFNGNLTTTDDTVQEIAQKLDDLVIPAAGIADPGGSNDDFLQRKSGVWTNRTVAQVKSDLGVEHPMFMETAAAISVQGNAMWLPGVEFVTPGGGTTNVALNMPAGTVALLPAVLTETVTITKIAHGVLVAQTNTHTFRMGIYSANSDWTTGTLVQSATYTSDGTTGLKTITSLSWTLTPGRYFYAYLIPPGESIPSGRWSIPTYRGGTTGHSNHPIGACASSTTSNATLPSSVTVTKVTSGGTPITASVWPWGVQG